ncbi:MAG: YebO family protein [Symbiopectobacterium sp.]
MLIVLFAALVWFFVNRASVRANGKIRYVARNFGTATYSNRIPSIVSTCHCGCYAI